MMHPIASTSVICANTGKPTLLSEVPAWPKNSIELVYHYILPSFFKERKKPPSVTGSHLKLTAAPIDKAGSFTETFKAPRGRNDEFRRRKEVPLSYNPVEYVKPKTPAGAFPKEYSSVKLTAQSAKEEMGWFLHLGKPSRTSIAPFSPPINPVPSLPHATLLPLQPDLSSLQCLSLPPLDFGSSPAPTAEKAQPSASLLSL